MSNLASPNPASSDSNQLHLVDFSNTDASVLQRNVEDALDSANEFLDTLERNSVNASSSASDALDTIIAFDHANLALDRHWGILSHLNSVRSNDAIRAAHHAVLPKLSAFGTRMGQHQPLFNLYQQVTNDPQFFAGLSAARQRALTLTLQRFELSGVALPKDKQQAFADIQSQLSTLSAKFADNILDATQAFALPLNESQLAGITDSGKSLLAAAAEQYNNKLQDSAQPSAPSYDYVATLDIPVYLAVMTYADDRNLRETLYKAYVTRASEFDQHTNAKGENLNNADIMAQIIKLRQQKADLLGYAHYADISLSTKMADDVPQVEAFLRDLADKARSSAQQDYAQLKDQLKDTTADITDIQPWDNAYLAEKVKQAKFSLSQEEIRPYFPLPTVIDGLFAIVNRLYGIRIQELSETVSRWHDDVRYYQLYDENDNLIGGFYFDLYARQGKRGGAWMSGFQSRYVHDVAGYSVDASGSYQQLPVCFMVGNFTPAVDGKPSLLTHDEVLTLFHEFGHGLHHLLTQVTVGDVAGVNGVEWDAVELPSQFMENWAWQREGIALISAHVDTGEPLPDDKLQALLAAKNFQSGMQTLRQIEFALFDLLLHAHNPALDYDGILDLLNAVRADIAITPTPEYNRFANGFSHIFAGGYAAGYYSYKWAELLSADAFSKFEEEGIFNAATGKAFRDAVLSVGGSHPAKTNFETFRGRVASIDALLRHSGFVDDKQVA